ncbi:MAG: Ig-like domain-containing protein [Steroidobacteraceae bacterium]
MPPEPWHLMPPIHSPLLPSHPPPLSRPSRAITATIAGAKSLATRYRDGEPLRVALHHDRPGGGHDAAPRWRAPSPSRRIRVRTAGAPTNGSIAAIFTKDMSPATITAAGTFTVTCTAPCTSPAGVVAGTVSYSQDSRTALFVPAEALTAGATYTATISTAATDSAGNTLAGNQGALPAASAYVWNFTAGAAAPAAPISVLATQPVLAAPAVCPQRHDQCHLQRALRFAVESGVG